MSKALATKKKGGEGEGGGRKKVKIIKLILMKAGPCIIFDRFVDTCIYDGVKILHQRHMLMQSLKFSGKY